MGSYTDSPVHTSHTPTAHLPHTFPTHLPPPQQHAQIGTQHPASTCTHTCTATPTPACTHARTPPSTANVSCPVLAPGTGFELKLASACVPALMLTSWAAKSYCPSSVLPKIRVLRHFLAPPLKRECDLGKLLNPSGPVLPTRQVKSYSMQPGKSPPALSCL